MTEIWTTKSGQLVRRGQSDDQSLGDPSPGMFFAMPSLAELQAQSSRKVLAHYFGPYPRSLNNAASLPQDTYTTVYNNPNYATYSQYGGMYRDRPIFRLPLGGDYVYQDCAWDIQQAMSAGIDGFFCDLLGLSGSNYDRYNELIQACSDMDNGFVVVPMVDANGATGQAAPVDAANYIRQFALTGGAGSAHRPSAWFLDDGRFVVGSFKAEGKPLSWWQSVFSELQSTWGLTVAFIGVYVDISQAASYSTIQWASGSWGYGADPSVISHASNVTAASHARGELALSPAVYQDVRPGTGALFDEALNSECLLASWSKIVTEGPEIVQMVTWSDFSETPMTPSAAHGWSVLDVSAYHIVKWKTGTFPAILRDCLILTHRSQTLDATITGPETTMLTHWPRGNMSAVRNDVEVLSFLTAPAAIELTVGGSTYNWNAPAGMSTAHYPTEVGSVATQALRDGQIVASVSSVVGVHDSDVSQDRGYYWFSSTRGTTGQFDVLSQY